MKSQKITKVILILPKEDMDVCTKLHSNPKVLKAFY